MSGTSPVITSLLRAVEAAPDDVALRVHLAELLAQAGDRDAAVSHAAVALQHDPTNAGALAVVVGSAGPPTGPPADTAPEPESHADRPERHAETTNPDRPHGTGFDWHAAEQEVGDVAAPMFVDDGAGPDPSVSAWDVERSTLTLADVGGMEEVKDRLNAAFLAPLRNPELRRLYRKSLRGGLLLYGPPGCGKTFLARAVAGELDAKFISVGLSDVLDMWVGRSEQNLHELFQLARREAPCVVFLDEVDALGQKRSQNRHSAMRGAVVQLLTELDGVDGANEGVFVLAATNQPWDVDPALRRPGRLDRTLLVLPPDRAAREAVFRYHLRSRPVEGIDLGRLAKSTDGFSGADIAHLCETASEQALLDGARTGQARMIGMADLEAARRQVRPSIGPWLDAARNVVLFGDDDGTYADLRAYLKKVKRL